jgi:hypothetical protein
MSLTLVGAFVGALVGACEQKATTKCEMWCFGLEETRSDNDNVMSLT